MRLGVERVHVMFIHDSDRYNGGLFQRDGTWRPSAHAVKHMISVLPAPKFIDAPIEGENDLYAYRFSPSPGEDAKPVTMVWHLRHAATARIAFPGTRATVTDLLGGTTTLEARDGFLEIPAGPLPVYVR